MKDYLEQLSKERNNILIAEIGALLHDIGKCHPKFIKKESLEYSAPDTNCEFKHAEIDDFLIPQLSEFLKSNKLSLRFDKQCLSISDIIKKHHHNSKTNDKIMSIFMRCDHKDSGDDKGIVREKQSINRTVITSPFGSEKEIINLDQLDEKFNELQNSLVEFFQSYNDNEICLVNLRKQIITTLEAVFSHVLGETRIPANDVTLWSHSYSVASLFKTALAQLVFNGEDREDSTEDLKWRILGICWNGVQFINEGKIIMEIEERKAIIDNIKSKLKDFLEEKMPIGNAIYEDINGIYFTFPNMISQDFLENVLGGNALGEPFPEEPSREECSGKLLDKVLKIIYDQSNHEIVPFFTLSEETSTLTIISNELDFSSKRRIIPSITPVLFVEGNEKRYFPSPKFAQPEVGEDLCPMCEIRAKKVESKSCVVCEERKKGTLQKWFGKRNTTIWIDEIADKNNRIALLSLDFYLDKWLDGTMISTIYSQTIEDWASHNKFLKQSNTNIDNVDLDFVYSQLNCVLNCEAKDDRIAILNTFFEDYKVRRPNDFTKSMSEIKEKAMAKTLSDQVKEEDLAVYFFTKNASPSRLYRIWNETQSFFEYVAEKIRCSTPKNSWMRLKFQIEGADKFVEKNGIFIIKMDDLKPSVLAVLYEGNDTFCTIESLAKYGFKGITGVDAIKEALKGDINFLASQENQQQNLLRDDQEMCFRTKQITEESYFPIIVINSSPLSARFIVPAQDSPEALRTVERCYCERFSKVIGKLPLNMKLLVANRKFPLYSLLDAENRMLDGEVFKTGLNTNPWWNVSEANEDKYFRFYPKTEKKKYKLDDLLPISKNISFWLYPGYFDFDLLTATTDRYNIYYNSEKRAAKDYINFTGRPYKAYQFLEMIRLWKLLSSNLSSSQIIFLEEILLSKLREWSNIEKNKRDEVFSKFAESVLNDVFGEKIKKLDDEVKSFIKNSASNGLLLDTIAFFIHIIKMEVDGCGEQL